MVAGACRLRHKRHRMRDDHPGFLQCDDAQEKADAGADGHLQRSRNGVDDPFPYRQDREDQEDHAGDEDGAECRLPRVTQPLDDPEGEVGVEPHARGERNRVVRDQPHHRRSER
jgi:hypothetical protein